MNRRRFLGSVPVLAVAGFVASLFGRVFGREKSKAFSAGRLRREPELMGGDIYYWEGRPPSTESAVIYHYDDGPCEVD